MTRPSMEHWAKSFFEKITLKHLQNTFGHFWEQFWAFLDFWNFFDFLENSRRLDPPWITGQKLFRKNHPKTTSKHVWTLLGTILGKFGFLNFFLILKIFVWTLLGTILGIFGTLKLFWFFLKIFEDSTLHGTLGKIFFEKITLKHLQNTFGHFWERLWALVEFWKFFDFFENFRRLDPPWNTGQKFFRKNHPKTSSKHVWTLLGTILGIFGILKIFWFIWKFSKTRPFMEHWAKNFFEKISPKYGQNTFRHFWGRFWAFLEFWNFCDFFENFRRLDPPWNTGQKFFFEKITSKHVQNLFGNFWERFWAFLEFWNFFWFWKLSFGHFWGRFWAFLEFRKFFDLFENFRRLDPSWNTGQKIFSIKSP